MSDPAGSELQLTMTRHGRGAVLALVGDVDFDSSPALLSAALAAVDQGVVYLVLDLGELGFCDSAGMHVFVSLHQRLTAVGGALALAAVPQQLSQLLGIVGLDAILPIYPTSAQALSATGAFTA
ncbi:STAS domain-containing protein [Streptacidiphilus sp. P02-A3a]|uniref:STAS domain-containing protein n=1 Tax=Streptacidiphilus sp. P02-A3a TaxID=2704468 RepID=UPI0015F9CF97|nr:STAS domain-containing protein [Streptacidiphilus sp. P02-A3a]QMU69704.1 STAS domain-containing protein [Streptacidiphilus sp. P02-A3a]